MASQAAASRASDAASRGKTQPQSPVSHTLATGSHKRPFGAFVLIFAPLFQQKKHDNRRVLFYLFDLSFTLSIATIIATMNAISCSSSTSTS